MIRWNLILGETVLKLKNVEDFIFLKEDFKIMQVFLWDKKCNIHVIDSYKFNQLCQKENLQKKGF